MLYTMALPFRPKVFQMSQSSQRTWDGLHSVGSVGRAGCPRCPSARGAALASWDSWDARARLGVLSSGGAFVQRADGHRHNPFSPRQHRGFITALHQIHLVQPCLSVRPMRLLRLESESTFSLVEYYGKSIPPYAILSHTWGADYQEVSFKDMMEHEGSDRDKLGYKKLYFCAKQAASDGLAHFWVRKQRHEYYHNVVLTS
jgi:hypothetical protein